MFSNFLINFFSQPFQKINVFVQEFTFSTVSHRVLLSCILLGLILLFLFVLPIAQPGFRLDFTLNQNKTKAFCSQHMYRIDGNFECSHKDLTSENIYRLALQGKPSNYQMR